MNCPECDRQLLSSHCACGWTDKKAVRASSVVRAVIPKPHPQAMSPRTEFSRFCAKAIGEAMYAPRGGFAKLFATLLRKWIEEHPATRDKYRPELLLWEQRVEENRSWWNERTMSVDSEGIQHVLVEFGK